MWCQKMVCHMRTQHKPAHLSPLLILLKALVLKVKVSQSCPPLCDPMGYRVHGILQARMLEWVAYPFSSGPSPPRNLTRVSCIAGRLFTNWAMGLGLCQSCHLRLARTFIFRRHLCSEQVFSAASWESEPGAGLSSTVRLLVKTSSATKPFSIKTDILFSWKGRHYAFSARLPWRLGATNTHKSISWSVRHRVGAQ